EIVRFERLLMGHVESPAEKASLLYVLPLQVNFDSPGRKARAHGQRQADNAVRRVPLRRQPNRTLSIQFHAFGRGMDQPPRVGIRYRSKVRYVGSSLSAGVSQAKQGECDGDNDDVH